MIPVDMTPRIDMDDRRLLWDWGGGRLDIPGLPQRSVLEVYVGHIRVFAENTGTALLGIAGWCLGEMAELLGPALTWADLSAMLRHGISTQAIASMDLEGSEPLLGLAASFLISGGEPEISNYRFASLILSTAIDIVSTNEPLLIRTFERSMQQHIKVQVLKLALPEEYHPLLEELDHETEQVVADLLLTLRSG